MRTWIITGGAGFIGANLVRLVLDTQPDVNVVVVDALTYAGHKASLRDVMGSPRIRFEKVDIVDSDAYGKVIRAAKPEMILHLAAESHVDRSIHGPGVFVRTNVQGTFHTVELAREIGCRRLVVVSTDEVYGSLGPTGLFREDTPLDPSSPYSASKAAADLLALSYHRTFGLDVVVTRCSNNYGPFQMPEKLIPLMVTNALSDRALPVYGDGMNVRDWIHVEDHCRGILLAAEKGHSGRVYNFGGEAERANLHVVKTILEHVGKPESLIRFVTDRPGHDRRYAMDISRVRAELGFEPRRGFEEGLRATIDWYRANQSWCDEVQSAQHREHLARNYENRTVAR